tara:strand:+ start:1651 stop:2448 length:798 start_codon:yes stop_codon:yes gene_type:complete
MKTFIGSIERKIFYSKIEQMVRSLKTIFILVSLLPIVIFTGYKFEVFKSSGAKLSNSKIGYKGVAEIISGSGQCSAFLISEKELMTACHCVEYLDVGGHLSVTFFGDKDKIQYDAILKYKPKDYDPTLPFDKNLYTDYAILEIVDASFDNFYPLQLDNFYSLQLTENNIEINDNVIVVGFPDGAFSASSGEVTNVQYKDNTSVLQLWAGAWAGGSGGPVFDRETAEVIGIFVGRHKENEGMLVAVKMDMVAADQKLGKVVELIID